MSLIERATCDEADEAIGEATDCLARVSADLASAGWLPGDHRLRECPPQERRDSRPSGATSSATACTTLAPPQVRRDRMSPTAATAISAPAASTPTSNTAGWRPAT